MGESFDAEGLSAADFFDDGAVSLATGLKLAMAVGGFVLVAAGALKLATAAEDFEAAAAGDFELAPRAVVFGAEGGVGAVARGAAAAIWRPTVAGALRAPDARRAFVSFDGASFTVLGRCTGVCRCFSRDAFHACASGATDTMAVRRTRNVLPERNMLPIHPNERVEAKNPGTYESAYEAALTPSG